MSRRSLNAEQLMGMLRDRAAKAVPPEQKERFGNTVPISLNLIEHVLGEECNWRLISLPTSITPAIRMALKQAETELRAQYNVFP